MQFIDRLPASLFDLVPHGQKTGELTVFENEKYGFAFKRILLFDFANTLVRVICKTGIADPIFVSAVVCRKAFPFQFDIIRNGYFFGDPAFAESADGVCQRVAGHRLDGVDDVDQFRILQIMIDHFGFALGQGAGFVHHDHTNFTHRFKDRRVFDQ